MTPLAALAGLYPSDYTGRMSKMSSNPDHVAPPIWRRPYVIVGRQPEMERLNAALGDIVTEGRGGLVFITGRRAEDRIGRR